MSDTGAVESFPAMLRRVLGEKLKPDVTAFPDMFAADGVMGYPYALPGMKTPLVGRDAIAANIQVVSKLIRIDGVTDAVVHEAGDPVTIVEFAGYGEGLTTGEPYHQRYVWRPELICVSARNDRCFPARTARSHLGRPAHIGCTATRIA